MSFEQAINSPGEHVVNDYVGLINGCINSDMKKKLTKKDLCVTCIGQDTTLAYVHMQNERWRIVRERKLSYVQQLCERKGRTQRARGGSDSGTYAQ